MKSRATTPIKPFAFGSSAPIANLGSTVVVPSAVVAATNRSNASPTVVAAIPTERRRVECRSIPFLRLSERHGVREASLKLVVARLLRGEGVAVAVAVAVVVVVVIVLITNSGVSSGRVEKCRVEETLTSHPFAW